MEGQTRAAILQSPAISLEAVSALRQGNRIEAIRIVRYDQGFGRKLAKAAVKAYIDGQPDLRCAFQARRAEMKRRLVVWVFALLGIGALAYFILVSS